jgi:hypothetical protein
MAIKKKIGFSINVDPEMFMKIKQEAGVENKSLGGVVRDALEKYFKGKGKR